MELRKGYKQTEVGILPNDWDLLSYDEAFNFQSTATYSREQLSANGDVYYVHYGDIHTKWKNFLDFNKYTLPTISERQAKGFPQLEEGDLIIVDASEDYEGVGTSIEIKNIGTKKAISGLHTFLLKTKNDVFVNGFKGYIHNNRIVKKQFDKLATGLKVYGVSRSNLKKVLVPLPPTKQEQSAIAQVLSDTDELISSLEKLIEKKRIIKLAAMQEFLSGKIRFCNYNTTNFKETSLGLLPADWKIEKLKRIADISIGLVTTMTTNYVKNGVPLIRNSDIVPHKVLTENMINLSYDFANKNKSRKLSKGDIVTVHTGDVGVSAVIPEELDGCIGFATINTRVKESIILPEYLCCYFNSSKFLSTSVLASTGDGRQNLNLKDFIHFEIPIPHIDEQKQIAEVLADMDDEIEALKQKLNKYKSIKQGMMQNLLTGKIRLV